MSDGPQNNPGNPIATEGFPIVYANLASLTANYNDLRIYFADLYPKTVATIGVPTQPGSTQQPISEAHIAPRICIVMTPEFTKSLIDALSGTLALYEKQFGPVRPAPQALPQKPATR
jgi:hypothetical protein